MFSTFQSKLGALWCSMAHQSVMWPVHGHYECRTCGRHFPAFPEQAAAELNGAASPGRAALSRA